MVGSAPDAGRNTHVCVEPGRLDHSALRKGIAVSKMHRLRYAMENGYGIAAKTPDVAIPAGNIGYYSTRCVPFSYRQSPVTRPSKKALKRLRLPPPPLTTIPVEEVATQATQVGDLIRGFAANVAPSSEIETIRKFLPQVSVDIALELKNTTNILKEQPSLETLQAQQEIWQQRQSQGTAWLKVLTDHATKLQVALTQLKKLQETWARTRDARGIRKGAASDPAADRYYARRY